MNSRLVALAGLVTVAVGCCCGLVGSPVDALLPKEAQSLHESVDAVQERLETIGEAPSPVPFDTAREELQTLARLAVLRPVITQITDLHSEAVEAWIETRDPLVQGDILRARAWSIEARSMRFAVGLDPGPDPSWLSLQPQAD